MSYGTDVPKSYKTWAHEQLGIGYAVKDALFLVRRSQRGRTLSSKCPGCSRWGKFLVEGTDLPMPRSGSQSLQDPKLLETVHKLRCIGCGIHPFAGAETITIRKPRTEETQKTIHRPKGRFRRRS